MQKVLCRLVVIGLSIVSIGSPVFAIAAPTGQNYYQGRIVAAPASDSPTSFTVKILDGPDHGKTVTAAATGLNSYSDITLPTYRAGDTVVVGISPVPESAPVYSVIDHYRLPSAELLLALVVAAAIVFAGWRGIGSLIGLGISLLVIAGFIIPLSLNGSSPYLVCIAGSFIIAGLSIFFAHGLSRRTVLALVSTCLTLLLAVGLSVVAVNATHLNGIANEDVSYLHQQLPTLNLQGLLLGGIIIGVLGVLDDITVGQAAVVEELRKANPRLGWRELYWRASMVGREHISSLINTLVLAYAGSSFIFIVYIASVQNLPIWLTLNSELVMEEIVRSLVGSLALILAVPIATLLSAYFLTGTWHQATSAVKRKMSGSKIAH